MNQTHLETANVSRHLTSLDPEPYLILEAMRPTYRLTT